MVFYHDALNPLPLADGSVKRIHCEHFLEHLDYDSAPAFLGECHRVLELGGTLRLIVPDAEKYISAYAASDTDFFSALRFLGNASQELETKIIICNQMFRMGGDHKFAWDFETLNLACCNAGFSKVSRSTWQAGPAEIQIDGLDDWRPLESIYCEIER